MIVGRAGGGGGRPGAAWKARPAARHEQGRAVFHLLLLHRSSTLAKLKEKGSDCSKLTIGEMCAIAFKMFNGRTLKGN